MSFEEFIQRVQAVGGMSDRAEADRALRAVLETLGERLFRTERDHLAAQLGGELKEVLAAKAQDDRYSLEEFYTRVGARADVRYHQAVAYARAVVAVLREAVSPGELRRIFRELPDEYRELFGEEPESPLSPTVQ
ncbi:MAG: DUF2267 domain-containing protein [Nitrospirota bacterium]|jgi:uncharacterized protein (DUF2267 family)